MNSNGVHSIALFINDIQQQNAITTIISELGGIYHFPSKAKQEWPDLSQNTILILDEENAKRSLAAISQLKQQNSRNCCPIIIVITQFSSISSWIELGADECIPVQIPKAELVSKLQTWMAHREKIKAESSNTTLAVEVDGHFRHQSDPIITDSNLTFFENELSRIIASAKRRKTHLALMYVDIMHFSTLTETLGPASSTLLIQEISKRLTSCLRKSDLVVHYKADEFVLVLVDVSRGEDAAIVANKIFKATAEPFKLNEHEASINISIGISVFPENGETESSLLKNADIAMNLAKEKGNNQYQFCSPDFAKRIALKSSIESNLKKAIQLDEFKLMYQPKVEISSGKVVGVEALIRWKSPNGELSYPTEFIPLAEELGEIIPITEWVLRTACRHIKMTQSFTFPRLNVSVNLSGKVFKDKTFLNSIDNVLLKTGLNPKYLDLEFSEKCLLDDIGNIVIFLKQLKSIGVQLSIDNFGTSQSSLSYLKLFAVDRLKIDRTIIRNIKTNPDDAAVTSAIISMAHSLNIKVVAEGVEQKDQLRFLEKAKCDEYQGYYFSKPLMAEELVPFLNRIKKDKSIT